MRACWIDAGSDPDYPKLAANGITWPYFDIREERLTPDYLDAVRGHAGIEGVGVYAVASWYPSATPEGFANIADQRLRQIGWRGNPAVMFDIEVADLVAYVLACLGAWRQLRPTRTTDLTIEGHKGALFNAADVINTVAKVRYVVPQCYDGAMNPWDTWAIVADLWAAGFPPAKTCPFYDAAHLLPWWGSPAGFAFTQGRLP